MQQRRAPRKAVAGESDVTRYVNDDEGIGDILSRKDAEANLRDFGNEWQRTFDAIAESATILRADGQILRTNRALLTLVRASEEEITGRSVRAS